MQASIHIHQVGLQLITVDKGRIAGFDRGFTQSGPMDNIAFELGQWLVGNCVTQHGFEVMGGLTISTNQRMTFSITGPDADVIVDGKPCTMWRTLELHPGQKLTLKPTSFAHRHYLAVKGKIEAESVLGSITTVSRESLGGINGDGTSIATGAKMTVDLGGAESWRQVPSTLIPDYTSDCPIDVIMGYQIEQFDHIARAIFNQTPYRVTNDISRMGYRLEGTKIPSQIGHEMLSEPIQLGAVQVPPNGQPIVMMCDRQTLGGYPKIGCVANYDLPRLVQTEPGKTVSFNLVDIATARAKTLLALVRKDKELVV